jgi:hypothetical protein
VRYVNRGTDDLSDIMLRLYPNTSYLGGHMQVTQASVDGISVYPAVYQRPTVGISGTTGQPITDTSVLSLPLPVPLQPGQAVTLNLSFAITIPLHATGGYHTFGWANDIVSLPEAYVMVPVHDGKGWHIDVAPTYGDIVYAEASLYRVHIRAPAGLVIVATGVCSSTPDQPILPGQDAPVWRETSCVAAPVRDFAWHASGAYQQATTTVQAAGGNVIIRSFYMPQYALGGQRALGYATQALLDYERRFGAYPYRELKVFASPNTAGGIEYPMLAGVTDSLYSQEGGYFEWITAHEVAHQWWYGMVGNDQVNEPWMDESLAQYATSLYIEDRYGMPAADEMRNLYFTSRYEHQLQIGRDQPVAQPTNMFDPNDYSPIVYGKGPLFFDAVRRTVGDQRFTAWLRVYFSRYRYRIAHADDLLAQADQTGIGDVVRQAYAQWMLSARRP